MPSPLPDTRKRMLVYLTAIAIVTTVLFPVAQIVIALIPGRMPFGWYTVLAVSYGVAALLVYAAAMWRPLPFMFIRRMWNDVWLLAVALVSFLLAAAKLVV